MNTRRRSEQGSGDAFILFMLFLAMWFTLTMVFILILAPSYDSKKECLEEWTKCDKVTETWEPTDEAEAS